MIRRSFGFMAVALLLPLLFFAVTVRAETGAKGGDVLVSGLVDVGVQQKDVKGSREKFEEYRDVKNGFLVNDTSVRLEKDSTRYFIDVKIKNPVQENEFYSLTGGKHGSYKYNVFFDSIPHNFSNGVLLFNGAGTNRLFIADGVQSGLQAVEQTRGERGGNPLVDTTGEDALAQGIVRGLYAEANPFTFRLKREKTGFSFEYDITNDVKTWARVVNEKRTGARVITAGTYERFAQGPSGLGHTADLFMVSGSDLAEPIDFRTTTFSVGAGAYKKSWLADLEYSFTKFKNNNLALIWDNPFRIDDASATGVTDNIVGNGYNRGRFARGQLSLVPDSNAHDFTLSAAADLPMHGRFSAALGYGWITQDDPFVPYTLNSALAGDDGGPASITDPSILPKSNLDGKVKNLTGSFVLAFKPVKPLKVALKYRYYDYDNKSGEILFPGYAAFGESNWRTVKNDKNAPVLNEPLGFTRQNVELGLDYHAAKPLTLLIEAGWEGWDREKLRIDGTDEYSIKGGIVYKMFKTGSLKASYKYAKRSVDGYKTGETAANPEAIGLTNYDWADRKRNVADARFQFDPTQAITVGLFARYLNDKFADDSRFGLKKSKNVDSGFDIAYSPSDRLTLFANYVKEYRKSEMRNGAKDDAFDIASTSDNEAVLYTNFNPLNYWNTDVKETTDTVGIGATAHIVPSRLTLNASYNLSYSRADFNTYNPNSALAIANGFTSGAKLANAVVQPWPTVTSRQHEIKTNLAYKWFSNLTVGVSYLFEWYKLDDFAWDNLNPYMAGLSAENSTRYVFADATYKKYEAHVGQIYMAYKF